MPTADKERKKIIILQELRRYCGKNNVNEIRYSELRELSDSFLNSYSSGFQTNMGGNFDKLITELHIQGLLERKRISPKRTHIVSNIAKIDVYFRKNDLKRLLDGINNVTGLSQMDSSDERSEYPFDTKQKRRFIADNISISEKLGMKVTRRKLRDFLKKDAGRGLSATLESNLVDISFAGDTRAETINKEVTTQLLELTQQIISQNNGSSPFMLILRYIGMPRSLVELDESRRFYDFYRKLGEYFVEWAERFERYKIDEEDKNSLYEGKLKDLTQGCKNKLKMFLGDLIDNNTKDRVSIPLVSEIYQKMLSQ